MPQAIPMTKKEAFEQWATQAYNLTSAAQKVLDRINMEIRRTIAEGKLRGATEKRLTRAIEDLEDQVDMIGVILLGPDTSQEERDEK